MLRAPHQQKVFSFRLCSATFSKVGQRCIRRPEGPPHHDRGARRLERESPEIESPSGSITCARSGPRIRPACRALYFPASSISCPASKEDPPGDICPRLPLNMFRCIPALLPISDLVEVPLDTWDSARMSRRLIFDQMSREPPVHHEAMRSRLSHENEPARPDAGMEDSADEVLSRFVGVAATPSPDTSKLVGPRQQHEDSRSEPCQFGALLSVWREKATIRRA